MKLKFKKLAFLLLFFVMTGVIFSAEPPGMFDQDNPAFGTCNNDVPPEILDVRLEPAQPKAGEVFKVIVKPWVDPYKSEAEIVKVSVFYSVDGMKTWSEKEAQKVATIEVPAKAEENTLPSQDTSSPSPLPSGERIKMRGEEWVAELGPFSANTTLDFRNSAIDSEDNMAVEIPPLVKSFPPDDSAMFTAALDTNDVPEYFGNNVDILNVSLGFDDEKVYMKLTAEGNITPLSGSLPNIYAVGYLYPDLRKDPITWNHELTGARMMIYVPFMSIIGFYNGIEGLMGSPITKCDYKLRGNSLYMSVGLDKIVRNSNFSVDDMKREGFKFAAATIAADLKGLNTQDEIPDLNKIVKPADCTSFSIVYPKVHRAIIE